MFILKKFAPKSSLDRPTIEWAIIPDGTIEELWENVISIYRNYFKDCAKEAYSKLIANPAIVVDNLTRFKNSKFDGVSLYITYHTPQSYRLLKESEYLDTCEKISRLFARILNDRIKELFYNRHGKFANFNQVVKIPANLYQVKEMVEAHNPDESIMVFTFHRECEEATSDILKEVKNTTHEIGAALSSAIVKKRGRAYEDVMRSMGNINVTNRMRVEKWTYPPSMQLAQGRSTMQTKMFRMCVYQDNVLVYEKRGNVISYAWIDMLDKMINRVKEHNCGSWVFVIGLIDICN